MKKQQTLRLLSIIVSVYLLMALGWWSILLHTKNSETFQAKKELMAMELYEEGVIPSKSVDHLEGNPRFQALCAEHEKQEWMIIGELSVILVSLLIAFWMINNGYVSLVRSAVDKRNFLLSITHELKSPLASIRLGVDTIKKRELTPELNTKVTESVLWETGRLENLVNNLLLAARMEGNYQPAKERILLAEYLPRLIDNQQMKNKNADLILDLEDPNMEIFADRNGLTSILVNLIENAIKYSPDEKHITIKATSGKRENLISVLDRGMGIPPDEKERITEKFYRIGNEDTRKTKGTGLGLFIVKRIIEEHKGKLLILDNEQKGSEFRICLPV